MPLLGEFFNFVGFVGHFKGKVSSLIGRVPEGRLGRVRRNEHLLENIIVFSSQNNLCFRSYTGPTLRSQLQLLKTQSQGPLRLDRQQALAEESEGNRSLPVGTIEPLSPLAPAPPPRKSGHNRAASLDLDKLEQLGKHL